MSHLFPVEATHLLFFARALGDPEADRTEHRTAIAAPTFTAAHVQFRPGYPLRPEPGQPWIGSGRGDSGLPAPEFGNGLHAEQGYVYHRPVRAGMVLRVTDREGRRWVRPRRSGGHLEFAETLTDFHDDATGELVQSSTQVGVLIHPEPAPADADRTGPDEPDGPIEPGAAAAAAGESRELLVVDGLTRTQLVMYAGASGDYNPLHTDEVFATRAAGYPSVFAHGMWTMGASARVLSEWFGTAAIRRYRARFRGQVWPGESLTARATVARRQGGETELDVVTSTPEGRVVMTGRAVVAAR